MGGITQNCNYLVLTACQRAKYRKPNKHSGKQTTSTRDVSDACYIKASEAQFKLKNSVSNFIKQAKRIQVFEKVAASKYDKRGQFGNVAAHLVELGGGNISNLSCAGSTTSVGANNLTNLVIALLNCDADITEECRNAIPGYDKTYVSDCIKTLNTFTKDVNLCVNKIKDGDVADSCICWENVDTSSVNNCKKIDEAKNITDAVQKCKQTFGQCKKYEDDAVNKFAECSGNYYFLLILGFYGGQCGVSLGQNIYILRQLRQYGFMLILNHKCLILCSNSVVLTPLLQQIF